MRQYFNVEHSLDWDCPHCNAPNVDFTNAVLGWMENRRAPMAVFECAECGKLYAHHIDYRPAEFFRILDRWIQRRQQKTGPDA